MARLLLFILVLAAACSDATTGKRVRLATHVAPVERTFTTATGWSVTLTKATLSTGAIYYFDAAPIALLDRVGGFFVKNAYAHPGHYQEENARGQVRAPGTVDLMSGGDLPAGDGVSGGYRSARVAFAPDAQGHIVVLEGTATREAATRTFRATAVPGDVLDDDGQPEVVGCRFVETDVDRDGTVEIRVKARVWLDQVDFTADGPLEGAAQRGFHRGLKSAAAFELSFR
jgi:hypothetical protein